MTEPTPVRLVQACLEAVLGVRLPIASAGAGRAEARVVVTHGSAYGDSWSGVTAGTHVTVEGLRHPATGSELGVRLSYAVHDLSGQIDEWAVTLTGFSQGEALALRDGLHPHNVDHHLNNHLRYRWVIDGQGGSEG